MPELEVAGARLRPLAARAAWLPDHRTLLVADVHLGKARSFTTWGVPVPDTVDALTLARLADALAETAARRLVVLGDWLHGPRALDDRLLQRLASWRAAHATLEVILIGGNHDRRSRRLPPSLGFIGVDGPLVLPDLPGLSLDHEPTATGVDDDSPEPAHYRLAGHLHPVVRLRGRADALRVPCFCFGPRAGLLPAFGEFTGGHVLRPSPGERLFAVAGDRICELPSPQYRELCCRAGRSRS